MIRSWTRTHWLVYVCWSMSNFVRCHRRSSLRLNFFWEAISLLYQGTEGRALIVFLCRSARASSSDDSTLWYRSESSETLKSKADDESRGESIKSRPNPLWSMLRSLRNVISFLRVLGLQTFQEHKQAKWSDINGSWASMLEIRSSLFLVIVRSSVWPSFCVGTVCYVLCQVEAVHNV